MNCGTVGRRVTAFFRSTPTAAALVVVQRCVFCGRTHSSISTSTPTPPMRTGFCRKCSALMSRTKSTKVCSAIASYRLAFRNENSSNGQYRITLNTDWTIRWLATFDKRSRSDGQCLVARPATPPTRLITLGVSGLARKHVGQTKFAASKPWSLAHSIAAAFFSVAA